MRIFGFTILAFIAGLIGGVALALGGYIIATSVFGVIDRDGGLGMSTVFILGPMLGLVIGLVAAISTVVVMVRRAQARG